MAMHCTDYVWMFHLNISNQLVLIIQMQ
jgi:hypothetical protein